MSNLFPLTMTDCVVRRQGKTVLGPVSLTVDQGGPTIIIGPNGSGKTTLLRVMHGIERLSAGAADWAQNDQGRQAYVFQSPIVLRRSVADNLRYPLQLIGVSKAEIEVAATAWLDRIGLSDIRNTRASRLSGGERQKLAIARALIRDPDVLFLDEPCANLDGHATREIEALLQETAAAGTRIIMSTHDMGQARRLAQDVIFMIAGKVHEKGAASEVLATPGTPELQAFLNGDIVT